MHKKIKVLHLINNLEIGGAEVLLFETLRKMNRERFSNFVAYLTDKGSLEHSLTSVGFEVFDLSWNGKVSPFLLFKLAGLLSRIKPDIVHTHSVQSDFVGHLVCVLRKFKNRVTTQHRAFHPKQKTLFYRLARTLTHRSAKVIAVSSYCRQYLVNELGYQFDNIRVVHNGIDLSKFVPKNYYGKKDKFVKIGTLGRLHTSKGLPTLIKAISRIAAEIDVRCTIPGSGELERDLKKMVGDYNLNDKVKFLGPLNEEEKIRYLLDLDIFVQPSYWEAFGIAILEAMAVGLPVIASDLDGIPELVIDRKSGLLVRPKDEKKLAQALIVLSKDPQLRRELGVNARKHATQFSVQKTVSHLENIYLEQLNG